MIYSPYRLLLPRYPQKGIYSMEEGRYHYLPEKERYRDLPVAPTPSGDWNGRDLLAEAVQGARAAGISPGAWVTIFANGLIAKTHTPWAVQNLYQSADRLFLCFNNPEVREYSLRVCSEIAERYELAEMMLDKIPQLCLEIDAFGGIRIDPVLRTLGSICYCPHCVAAAKEYGIDLEACRQKSLWLAAKCLAIPPHVVCSQRDDLTATPRSRCCSWMNLGSSTSYDFASIAFATFSPNCASDWMRFDRGRAFAVFIPPVKIGHDSLQPRPWLAAQSYAAYKEVIDLIHCVVHWGADEVEYNTRRAVDAVAGGVAKIVTHIRCYGESRPENLPSLVGAVERGGASGVGYFCYDLMSQEMLDSAAGLCER